MRNLPFGTISCGAAGIQRITAEVWSEPQRPQRPNTGPSEGISPSPFAIGELLVGEFHHFRRGDAERPGELADIRQGYVSVTALDTTDVASVQIAFQGDSLLRQTLSSPELSEIATKQHPRIV